MMNVVGVSTFSWAQETEIVNYVEMELEELLQVKIVTATSAARKQQALTDTAAALFVITQEDIRRAGITSLPEALRLTPGIQVACVEANKWAITIRGFNGRYSSKLLVMIDG